MLRTTSLRAAFSLPAVFAAALLGYSSFAYADVASRTNDLNLKLQEYAREEGKLTPASTSAQIAAVNVQTASADDLVFAVYDLASHAGDNPQDIADIASAALTAAPGATPAAAKVRADKDTVVGRIMEAAVVASSTSGANGAIPADQNAIVDKLLQQLGTVNAALPTTKQLTVAGKELLVAKALRSTSGLGAAIADRVATSGFYATATTTKAADANRTAFTIAALKLLAFKPITNDPSKLPTTNTFFPIRDGAQMDVRGEPAFVEGTPPSLFGVRDYVDTVLDGYMDQATTRPGAALAIATGVAATVPAAAGETIAGYVQDLKTGNAAVTNADILNYLKGGTAATSIVANAKLAAAVSDIVADTFKLFKGAGATTADAVSLATSGSGTGSVAITAALKGKIASGAIRANPGQAAAIVDSIISINDGAGKAITQTTIAAFAGAAAQGNSTAGADINTAAINRITYVPAAGASPTAAAQAAAVKADNTKIQAVAIAVGKSLALVDPNATTAVAESLFSVVRNGSNPYSVTGAAGEVARQNLAVALATGLATNYAAAGAAVSGVVHQSLVKNPPADATTALNQAAVIAGVAIKAAPKATIDIALRVAANAQNQSFYSTKSSSDLATAIATAKVNGVEVVASANAGAVAAGVSLYDTANTGLITAAVINAGAPVAGATPSAAFNARQAAALTIANTVAINVDVEAIGLIAKSVGELLQPAKLPSGAVNPSKLPKITSIGTLATSLAKAINTKPLVSWTNRVDELGELAAELTKQYLANSGIPDGLDSANSSSSAAAVTEQKALASGLASIGTSIFKAVSAKLLADASHNAADVADIAENVSGAIAQAINHTSLNASVKTYLLTSQATGSLIKLLTTAATASKSTVQVTDAFGHVVTAGANDYATGTDKDVVRADGTTGRYENGAKYEVGNVVGAETPIKNI